MALNSNTHWLPGWTSVLYVISDTIKSAALSIPFGPFCECCRICKAHYLSSTPRVRVVSHREVAERRLAMPPHGIFTPTAVLTEPPNAVKRSRREYHCHPDCHRHAGSNPTLEQVISLSPFQDVIAYQTRRLMLSHIIRAEVSANEYSIVKVPRGFPLSAPYCDTEGSKPNLFFQKIFNKFFKCDFSLLYGPIRNMVLLAQFHSTGTSSPLHVE